jgi:hypothetical protein
LRLEEGSGDWDIEMEFSVAGMGPSTPSGAQVEASFLQNVMPLASSPSPNDFEATSDLRGWLDLPEAEEDGTFRRSGRVHLRNYLADRPRSAIRLVRELQESPVLFRLPTLGGGSHDVPVQFHFGFDPGFFLLWLDQDRVPPGYPGLLNPETFPDFATDTTGLVPGGGPGDLGIELLNREVILPNISQDRRGDYITRSEGLGIDADGQDPESVNTDNQVYPVVTTGGAAYLVDVTYCDSGDSCLTRSKMFVAP